jgi:acyl-CoA reductase-like NAD-dependent aldehyde dehydrogenase
MRSSLPALALLLTLSSVAACGGGGGLSKEEFIAQGDAACEKLEEESEAVPAPTAEEEAGKYLDALLGIAKKTQDELAALDAPSDGEELQSDMVDAYDKAIELMESAKDAAGSGDLESMGEKLEEMSKEAEQQEKDGKSVAERVEDYGFESCGSAV